MKKTLLISSLLAVFSTTAMAEGFDQYITAKGTVARMQNKFSGEAGYENKRNLRNHFDEKKSDTIGGFRIGYGLIFPAFDGSLRGEIEYGYNSKASLNSGFQHLHAGANKNGKPVNNQTDVDYSSSIKSQFLMANAYYDFNTGTAFTPYVGAGIGYGRLKTNNDVTVMGNRLSISETSNNFIWNVGVGVAFAIDSNLAIDAGYRFTDYGSVKKDHRSKIIFPGKTEPSKYPQHIGTKSKVRSNEFNLGIRYTF